MPPPDWLAFELPKDQICLVTDDGSQTTVKLTHQLAEQGWNVVVLSFAQVPSSPTPLPNNVERIVLQEGSDAYLKKTLDAIAKDKGLPAVFIHLHPSLTATNTHSDTLLSSTESDIVKQVFFLAKHLKASLAEAANSSNRAAFLAVARLDGAFGLDIHTEQPAPFSPVSAGLFGLVKTLGREWPSVFCRAVDLHPATTAQDSVACILAELHDGDHALAEVSYNRQGRFTLMAS